jgi:hypothetical protein
VVGASMVKLRVAIESHPKAFERIAVYDPLFVYVCPFAAQV